MGSTHWRFQFRSCLILMFASMLGSMLQLPAVGGGSQMATIATLSSVFDVPPEMAASCGILLVAGDVCCRRTDGTAAGASGTIVAAEVVGGESPRRGSWTTATLVLRCLNEPAWCAKGWGEYFKEPSKACSHSALICTVKNSSSVGSKLKCPLFVTHDMSGFS